MYWRVVFFVSLIAGCVIENVKGTASSAIPDLLYDCYRSNFSAVSKPPLTVKLLVELIRKIELNKENSFNMRILATSMLHGVILDGVRKSPRALDDPFFIPYRATGEEFYKYKLLVDYLTSGESSLFPSESLTTPEICFLHKMVSHTVDPWRRGDESTTCVHQSSMPFELFSETRGDSDISACPIKKGNVYTKWGTVSAGHIIAATASALEQSEATFERIEDAINKATNKNVTAVPPTITTNTNHVNNVWVSTIAGDLAAVILNQATTTPEIGVDGFWNDTLLPRVYYLKSAKWDMTETDILAGIDALAIASYAKSFSGVTGIRLSQLIDMYYSERGIMGDKEYKVTNRSATLNKLLKEIDLKQQVAGSAQLLRKVGTYDVLLSNAKINQLSSIVTDKFRVVAGNITRTYDSVEAIHGKQMKSPVEVIVILDGSYDAYTAQQMIHALSEAVQVSHYSSKLGVINGQSGNWMANVTGELFQVYADLQKASENEWPKALSLYRSLETAIFYYQSKTTTDCSLEYIRPIGRSIVIVSPKGRLTDNDFMSSVRTFNSIKNSNPEIHFMLVTTSEGKSSFSEFTRNFRDNDYVLTPPESIHSLVKDVSDTLSTIPGNIINFYCSQSQVHLRDYITPNVETSYHIRREYIKEAQITTKFSVGNNGDLSVCASSDSRENRVCKDVTVNGEISFDSEELCAPESACNLEFRVALNDSKIICTDNSCRYPDQVRLDITWQRSSGFVPSVVLYVQCVTMSVLILIY